MAEVMKYSDIPELPDHLKHSILACLPLECLCRFRSVCKDWNALLSSTRFTAKWKQSPFSRTPWLVVQNGQSQMAGSLAYSFFTHTWKKTCFLSLSFLKQKGMHIDFHGSAAGLLLLGLFPAFVVFNPLTRTSLTLPPISSIRSVRASGIMEGDGGSRDTYKVVALGPQRGEGGDIVEIYDSNEKSNEKSWRIAGQVPENVWVMRAGMGMQMVFCDGALYCLAIINGGWGIMGFNIKEGTFFSAALPETARRKQVFPYLLTCGSQVVVTGGKLKDGEQSLLQEVIIWEFVKVKVDDNSSSCLSCGWKEIGVMPPSMCEEVNTTVSSINGSTDCPILCCLGVGDYACFILNGCMQSMEVVFYNVIEKTWGRLPSCRLEDEGYVRVMEFEPRPDMKVG